VINSQIDRAPNPENPYRLSLRQIHPNSRTPRVLGAPNLTRS